LVIGGGARKWCRRRDQIDQRRRQHRDLHVHRHTIPLIDNDSGTALRRRVMFVGTLPQSPLHRNEVLSTKAAASSGTRTNIDAFIVRGTRTHP